MKKTFIIGGLVLFIFGLYIIVARLCPVEGALAGQNVALNNKISANEHPTKEEWLEVYVTHKIKQFTDLYAQRIAVRVAIVSKAKETVITLTSANEQEEMSRAAKKIYVDEVEKIVKSILKEYDWTKNYKLTVQYI
ncbi:MAG: hypothetical protein ACXACA_07455 [Candidatus Ranarchaeia archaeon]|jgi:hypothetical protein